MSATEALSLFRARKLSPVELMNAVIKRAGTVNKKVNAFTFTHFDEALAAARKAEAKYAKGGRVGALEGLPAAIKDESWIKGKPTSYGSLIYKDFVPVTSPNNERILKAGGIVHKAHGDPGILLLGHAHQALGRHAQSVEPEIPPGGSSGGSPSLASGTTPIATGSTSAVDPHSPVLPGVVG
jgi:amidase